MLSLEHSMVKFEVGDRVQPKKDIDLSKRIYKDRPGCVAGVFDRAEPFYLVVFHCTTEDSVTAVIAQKDLTASPSLTTLKDAT